MFAAVYAGCSAGKPLGNKRRMILRKSPPVRENAERFSVVAVFGNGNFRIRNDTVLAGKDRFVLYAYPAFSTHA